LAAAASAATLIENAVARGIANLPEGGTVRIEARCNNGRMFITIENRSIRDAPPKRGNGMGHNETCASGWRRGMEKSELTRISEGERYEATVTLPAEMEGAR